MSHNVTEDKRNCISLDLIDNNNTITSIVPKSLEAKLRVTGALTKRLININLGVGKHFGCQQIDRQGYKGVFT